MAKSVVLARTSLADMRRHRKQVIIVFNDADLDDLANHIFAGLIWSDQLLDGTPATSRSVSELVSHLDATYRYLFNFPTKYSSPFSQPFPHLLSTYFPTCFNLFPAFPQLKFFIVKCHKPFSNTLTFSYKMIQLQKIPFYTIVTY